MAIIGPSLKRNHLPQRSQGSSSTRQANIWADMTVSRSTRQASGEVSVLPPAAGSMSSKSCRPPIPSCLDQKNHCVAATVTLRISISSTPPSSLDQQKLTLKSGMLQLPRPQPFNPFQRAPCVFSFIYPSEH